jgi:hypothetical protein
MAKHAAKHRKPKRPARRIRKGGAISMAALLAGGLVLASPAHPALPVLPRVHAVVLLTADSVVFIDGNNYPDGSTRMGTQLQSKYTLAPYSNPSYINNTQVYPGTLGLYNGFGKPTGDQSIADGQQALDSQIKADRSSDPTGSVTVVGYSEGAVAVSDEHTILQQQGYPSTGLNFVLIADADRPNGGILARLPAGTYIPLLGITGGNATSSGGAPVVLVTRQYDGIADAPAYPVNGVADLNAILGAYYLHPNYYNVDSDPTAPGNIVTTSPNGNLTDILVTAPPGQLPLFMPLASAGVPQPILVALDPVTRAIIETGYDRTTDPSQQVTFQLLPPPSSWFGDVQSVAAGGESTLQQLPGALLSSLPGAPALPAPLVTPAVTPPVPPPVTPTVFSAAFTPAAVPAVSSPPGPVPAPSPPPLVVPPVTSLVSSTPPTTPPGAPNMLTGNMVKPASTSTGGSTPSSSGNPLQNVVAGVTKVISSLTSHLPKSPSSGGTSSGSSGSHG